ncbi:hypothetical protein LTR50_004404 [Elasticomyces elasticus]|nr:hypothetical protein LTR50_004404 [Elasticomyces elasticus]
MLPDACSSPSPTVVLPPQPSHRFVSAHALGHRQQPQSYQSSKVHAFNRSFGQPNAMKQPAPSTRPALAGRKRSRYGTHSPEEEDPCDGSFFAPQPSPPKPRGEPVYGPGMTLIYPNDPGYPHSLDAASQSGTWVEEVVASTTLERRPLIASRKSQRLGASATGLDDVAACTNTTTPRRPMEEPLIDGATRMLGISWVQMNRSAALEIAAKAYAKVIQNHFPSLAQADVEILCENTAVQAYLVEISGRALETGYYLFSNDLKEARLITRDPKELVSRCGQLPVQTSGEIIRAVDQKLPSLPSDQSTIRAAHEMEVD